MTAVDQALVGSIVVLWIIVVILSVVVYALMRQIGVLHERVFPAGALMTIAGPVVGEAVAELDLLAWSGSELHIGGVNTSGISTLILFVSPSCPVCKTLLPYLDSVQREEAKEKPLRIILASDGERKDHENFVENFSIDTERYVLSQSLGLAFLVEKLPFAALIDEQGILRAKGLVNSREHLESLFEARKMGVSSLQDYFANEGLPYEAA